MLFLIDYDRSTGLLMLLKTYLDSGLEDARLERIELELKHYRLRPHREIVLLEASTLGQLLKTHGRYFFTAEELLARFSEASRTRVRGLSLI